MVVLGGINSLVFQTSYFSNLEFSLGKNSFLDLRLTTHF